VGRSGAKAVQREGRAGTVREQALEPGAVMGGDADRAVEAEAAGATPREHVPGVCFREQTTTDVEPKDASLEDGREGAWALGTQLYSRPEPESSFFGVLFAREQPVGDRQMEMGVRIEAGAEAVQEGDGAQAGVLGQGISHCTTEFASNHPEQDAQHCACQLRVPHQVRS